MCYERMGELLNKTEKYDPITPKFVKAVMKNDSRTVKSLADRWNWDFLGEEAQRNIDKPEEGVAKASVATALGFLGAGAGNYAQAANAANGAAGIPAGLEGTMEAALMDTGYTPSSLMNAFQYGPESGQTMGQTMQNYGQGLMGRMSSPGARQQMQRMAVKQGMGMMEQPNQPPPPPPPPPRPQEPMMTPYMTEEEKRRFLMMQNRGIY